MNIKITIDAPELAGAIETLALALNGMNSPSVSIDGASAGKAADAAAKEKERLAALQKADAEKAKLAAAAEKAEADAATENAIEEATTPKEPTISFQSVKDKLMGFSRTGRQAEMKDLITSFGAAKLSDIPEEKYAELIEKADALL